MLNKPLYQIADQYQALLERLYDDETGEVNIEVESQLNALDEPLETKCINITKFFKEAEKERVAIEVERKNMAARERALKQQVEWAKDYLRSNMERCKISKIECPQFVISLQKNPPSVSKYDESQIPDEYKKVTVEFDTAKIRSDLMNGVVIPGANLVQNSSVRIK